MVDIKESLDPVNGSTSVDRSVTGLRTSVYDTSDCSNGSNLVSLSFRMS